MKRCYTCKHRRDLINNAHSECDHPLASSIGEDPLILRATDPKIRACHTTEAARITCWGIAKLAGVELHPRGVGKGWALWPNSFDPVWVVSCNLYERKDDDESQDQRDNQECNT